MEEQQQKKTYEKAQKKKLLKQMTEDDLQEKQELMSYQLFQALEKGIPRLVTLAQETDDPVKLANALKDVQGLYEKMRGTRGNSQIKKMESELRIGRKFIGMKEILEISGASTAKTPRDIGVIVSGVVAKNKDAEEPNDGPEEEKEINE